MAVSVDCSCSSSLTPSLRSSFKKKKKRKEWLLVNIGKGVVILIREIPIKIISNYQNGKDIKVYFTLPLTIETVFIFVFLKAIPAAYGS